MELWTTIKKDWVIIAIWVIVLLLLILSFANINWEKPKFKEGYNWIWYLILILIGVFSFIATYHFLKSPNLENENKFAWEFLKVLLPTLLAILSLLYALSSGLFNIKNETLKKNKANLQYEINKLQTDKKGFEKEKETITLELHKLTDSLYSKEETLAKKNEEILSKQNEIESFKKSVDEIKEESDQKNIEIQKLETINTKYQQQLKKRAANITKPIVELVKVFTADRASYTISIYDANLKQLTDKDVGLLNNAEYQTLASFDTQTNKFSLFMAYYTEMRDASGKLPNRTFPLKIYRRTTALTEAEILEYNSGESRVGSNGLDLSSPWTIPVPYITAEYKIILNDF